MTTTTIGTILLPAFLNVLVLGSVAGLIVGAILILHPDWLVRANLINNRWISTRHLDKSLERSINFDSLFYRYRRVSGLVTLAGAIYILYYFGVQLDKSGAISGLARNFKVSVTYIEMLFDPMVWIALAGAAFALIISVFMLFPPNLFRRFELGANNWISLRRTMKPLEILHNNVDEYTCWYAMNITQKL
jgi:hypothetical protein